MARALDRSYAPTSEGFSDLCMKAHDIKIHLNKHKKHVKETGKFEYPMGATIGLKGGAAYVLGPS